MKTIVIRPTNHPQVEDLAGWEDFKKVLDDAYIECIRFTDNTVAYLDEDGKSKGLPYNPLATQWCRVLGVGLRPDDFIVGTMIIVGTLNEQGQHDGDEHDVPADLIVKMCGIHPANL